MEYREELVEDLSHIPVVSDQIEIRRLDKSPDHLPSFAYTPIAYGQRNYIIRECNDNGIRNTIQDGEVQIFSRKKLPIFKQIITDSFIPLEKDHPPWKFLNRAYWRGRALISVLISECKEAYVTENHMEDLVYHIYMRNIPQPTMFKIFSRKAEMVNHLLDIGIDV